MPDKRTTLEEIVGELRDGMTIGIGGWGSRRKPMAFVRAILRSSVTDLTIVSYGGPDVGLLCAAGKVRKVVYAFVSLDSIALEPHFRNARQAGSIELARARRGHVPARAAGRGLAGAVPADPRRARLRRGAKQPEIRTVTSPYDDGEDARRDAGAAARRRAHPHEPGRQRGNAQFLGPDLYFDDLMCMAAAPVVHVAASGSSTPTTSPTAGSHAHPADQPAVDRRRGRDTERRALHRMRSRLRARRGVPEGVRRVGRIAGGVAAVAQRDWIDVSEADYQRKVAAR